MAIHTATSEAASRMYTLLRVKLAICIASAISRCGYRTKMSILGDRSILNTQIYNYEHSETLKLNFITINFGKNFWQALNKLVVVVVRPNNPIML